MREYLLRSTMMNMALLGMGGSALVAAAAALPVNATRSSTCPSQLGPGLHTIRMDVPDAVDPEFVWSRAFDVYVPAEMDPNVESPTMLMWHGCGSDPEKFQEESEMNQRVGRFGYYAVWPRGTSSTLEPSEQHTCISAGGTRCGWNSGFPNPGGCQTPSDPRPDDVDFAERILAWMEGTLCVDMERVYIAGFSNGGSMTYKLNCMLSQRFAGMMTLGSAVGGGTTPGGETCNPEKQLPAINVCGSTDGCCGGAECPRVLEQVELFSSALGCTGPPERSELSSTSYCWAATGCPDGLPVTGCGISNLGHCWPNYPGAGDPPCQNQNPANFDASVYVLDYFTNLDSFTPPPAEKQQEL